MKFIAFFAFVATVNAITTIVLSSSRTCDSSGASHKITRCGTNVIPHSMKSASITDNEFGVIFYKKGDCTGSTRKEVKTNKCLDLAKLGFQPKCLSIVC